MRCVLKDCVLGVIDAIKIVMVISIPFLIFAGFLFLLGVRQ